MRWLDSSTNSANMNLSKLREMARVREAWRAVVHGVAKSRTPVSNSTTEQTLTSRSKILFLLFNLPGELLAILPDPIEPFLQREAFSWNIAPFSVSPAFCLFVLCWAQSCLTLATPWTTARQAPQSKGFSRQALCTSSVKASVCIAVATTTFAGNRSHICMSRAQHRAWDSTWMKGCLNTWRHRKNISTHSSTHQLKVIHDPSVLRNA